MAAPRAGASGRLRIGVVGCGFFARNHLSAWRELAPAGAVLAAVCDRDPARAEQAARDFSVPRAYTDARAMLDAEALDLVDIATRMDTHRALVELAIAHRVPTVVQKPMAPDLADGLAMVEAAREADVFLAVHENFRFQSPVRRAKAIIDTGEIGEPTWARLAFRTGVDVYANQPYFRDETRLVILDLGVHLLDLARFFLGEACRVSCETQRRNPEVKAEDTATMLLRHRSGAVSLVECTYENRRSDLLETLVEIEGSAGGIDISPGGGVSVVSPRGRREERVPPPALAWARPPLHFVQESVLATCRHMLEAVREGREAETSGADNLETFRLVEAAYRAAATASAVRLG